MNPATYRAQINRAIAHTGLRVFAASNGGRSLGYSYFKDVDGNQVGESVYVYRQSQLTLAQWVSEAEARHKEAGEPPVWRKVPGGLRVLVIKPRTV